MDECEALCKRLTIMVDGVMKCIGNVQYLKSRYAQGYTIMITLSDDGSIGVAKLKADVERQFTPNVELKDEHQVRCFRFNFIWNINIQLYRINSLYTS